MRGAPIIQAVIIIMVLGLLGFAGMHFIQGDVHGMSHDSADKPSSDTVVFQSGEIPIEVECYFSDQPENYSFSKPGKEGADEIILKAAGSESPVFHELLLQGEADNVLWLDVTWADQKPRGHYFVQLVVSVGNEEPLTRTFRSRSNSLQGTIELELSNLKNDE